jgi:hypothetical protein
MPTQLAASHAAASAPRQELGPASAPPSGTDGVAHAEAASIQMKKDLRITLNASRAVG